jgi:hypothetical protein
MLLTGEGFVVLVPAIVCVLLLLLVSLIVVAAILRAASAVHGIPRTWFRFAFPCTGSADAHTSARRAFPRGSSGEDGDSFLRHFGAGGQSSLVLGEAVGVATLQTAPAVFLATTPLPHPFLCGVCAEVQLAVRLAALALMTTALALRTQTALARYVMRLLGLRRLRV